MPQCEVDAIADPLQFLHRSLCAASDRVRASMAGDHRGFVVDIVDRQSGAHTRWQWQWTRGISPAADRAAEDDVYRQTIALLAEDGLIQLPARTGAVR